MGLGMWLKLCGFVSTLTSKGQTVDAAGELLLRPHLVLANCHMHTGHMSPLSHTEEFRPTTLEMQALVPACCWDTDGVSYCYGQATQMQVLVSV